MGLKDLTVVSSVLKAVRKVKWAYSSTANQGLFGSVMLLWGITIVQKLGSHLRLVILKTLRKVRQVLHTGLTNVYGQAGVVLKKVHQKVKSMLKVQGRN